MNSWQALLTTIPILAAAAVPAAAEEGPVWPPPPAEARVAWHGEISCGGLDLERGFLGKVADLIGGEDEGETLARPFDVLVAGDLMYLTLLDRSALVEVDRERKSYREYDCEELPLVAPVALAACGGTVYVSDSGRGAVYRLEDDRLEPWVTEGLVRPTGLACSADGSRIHVVDTGDHLLKVYDIDGNLQTRLQGRGEGEAGFNFPTFAAWAGAHLLVNDTLNYEIKRLDAQGGLLSSFGEEGDGPGTFARPKGVAVDGPGNVWVVDALFDNVQVFDPDGRLLLVIGGRGRDNGEFWSPAGIAIDGDLVYVADTYNDRIQILKYLGGGS